MLPPARRTRSCKPDDLQPTLDDTILRQSERKRNGRRNRSPRPMRTRQTDKSNSDEQEEDDDENEDDDDDDDEGESSSSDRKSDMSELDECVDAEEEKNIIASYARHSRSPVALSSPSPISLRSRRAASVSAIEEDDAVEDRLDMISIGPMSESDLSSYNDMFLDPAFGGSSGLPGVVGSEEVEWPLGLGEEDDDFDDFDDRVGWESFFLDDSEMEGSDLLSNTPVFVDLHGFEAGETTDEEEFTLIKMETQSATHQTANVSHVEDGNMVITTAHRPPVLATWERDMHDARQSLIIDGISTHTASQLSTPLPILTTAAAAAAAADGVASSTKSAARPTKTHYRSPSPHLDDILDSSMLGSSSPSSSGATITLSSPRRSRRQQRASPITTRRRHSSPIAKQHQQQRIPVGLFRRGITASEKTNGRDKRAAMREWYALQQKRQRSLRQRSTAHLLSTHGTINPNLATPGPNPASYFLASSSSNHTTTMPSSPTSSSSHLLTPSAKASGGLDAAPTLTSTPQRRNHSYANTSKSRSNATRMSKRRQLIDQSSSSSTRYALDDVFDEFYYYLDEDEKSTDIKDADFLPAHPGDDRDDADGYMIDIGGMDLDGSSHISMVMSPLFA